MSLSRSRSEPVAKVQGGERGRIEENDISDTSIIRWAWHDSNASGADNHGIYFTGPESPRICRAPQPHPGTFDALAPCGTGPPSGGLTTEADVYDNHFSELGDGIKPNRIARTCGSGAIASAAMMGISCRRQGLVRPGYCEMWRIDSERHGSRRMAGECIEGEHVRS